MVGGGGRGTSGGLRATQRARRKTGRSTKARSQLLHQLHNANAEQKPQPQRRLISCTTCFKSNQPQPRIPYTPTQTTRAGSSSHHAQNKTKATPQRQAWNNSVIRTPTTTTSTSSTAWQAQRCCCLARMLLLAESHPIATSRRPAACVDGLEQ